MKPYIIGVDPGLMTGVALVSMLDKTGPKLLYSHELELDGLVKWMDVYCSWAPQDKLAVVVERFIITPQTHKNGQATWSLENIGVVKSALLRAHGNLDSLVMSSTNAKKFSTNEKLRATNLWHKGGAGHANDALRHVLHYLVSAGWSDARLLKKS